MFWIRSLWQIIDRWHLEIDHGLETGQPPLLQMGLSQTMLDNSSGHLALYHLVNARNDATTPIALIGGVAPEWLLALFQQRNRGSDSRAPALQIIFSGSDDATAIASTALLHRHETQHIHHGLHILPQSYSWRIAPTQQPGSTQNWEMLPILTATDTINAYPASDERQGWIAWSAVALVVVAAVIAMLA